LAADINLSLSPFQHYLALGSTGGDCLDQAAVLGDGHGRFMVKSKR
jgi:hypothetical protein